MLKLLTLWRITSHNGSLEDKSIHEDIEHLKNWINLRIYQRRNETFYGSLSFLWRLLSPSSYDVTSFLELSAALWWWICMILFWMHFLGTETIELKLMSSSSHKIFTFHKTSYVQWGIKSIPTLYPL